MCSKASSRDAAPIDFVPFEAQEHLGGSRNTRIVLDVQHLDDAYRCRPNQRRRWDPFGRRICHHPTRQLYRKGGALTDTRFNGHRMTEQPANGLHDGETEPDPFGADRGLGYQSDRTHQRVAAGAQGGYPDHCP